MAISKILYMKDCGNHFPGKHLKVAINYILELEKTQNGKFIGGLNCQPDLAYEQMKRTKEIFGKTNKRQGYHIILSFEEGEVDANIAFEIVSSFAKEYLGKDYEAVYSVHDNTKHIHGHIIFNSVSFCDGLKFHYKKGDWAKYIKPVTNRICKKYGLSTIQMTDNKKKPKDNCKEWNDNRDGKFVWSAMIKRDLDACIIQAPTFDGFLELLREKGYEIKQGKYLAVRPPGMNRYKRCKTLGDAYSEESIKERIGIEGFSLYRTQKTKGQPRIIHYKEKWGKKRKLSGLQKKYYARLYKTGQLKKKPYSQAWKYKDDIKKMHKLQEQYLFLVRHDIHHMNELVEVTKNLTKRKKEVSKEKSKVFKDRARYHLLFKELEEIQKLLECENSFQAGDNFFLKEHNQWITRVKNLKRQGYSIEEIERLKEYFRKEIVRVKQLEKEAVKEFNVAKSILNEGINERKREEIKKEKNLIVEEQKIEKQPKR